MKYHLILSSIAIAATAHAVVFVNPSLAILPPPGPVVLGPLAAPPLVSTVVDNAGNFTATLTSTVHTGGSNPLGGLTFTYTLSNDVNIFTSPNDDLYAFSVRWDAGFVPALIDVDSLPVGIAPFSFAFGPNGIAFSFNFASLPQGATSTPIVIGTTAPAWVLGDAGIINGTTEDARAMVPVPEPATFAGLFALGLAGFAAFRRFRC